MKKLLFALSLAAAFFAGCSDSSKQKTAATEPQLSADAQKLQSLTDALCTVQENAIVYSDRSLPENAQVMQVINALKELKQGTAQEFFARTPRNFDVSTPAGKALSARHARFMPFFAEDSVSGTIYLAPADVQNAIISQWHTWTGKNLESVKLRSAAPIPEAAPIPSPAGAPAGAFDETLLD